MNKNKENTYETTNFHLASWFLMNDISLKDVKWNRLGKTGRERATFIFKKPKNRKKLTNKFFKNEMLQKKINADQRLKRVMYANHSPVEYND